MYFDFIFVSDFILKIFTLMLILSFFFVKKILFSYLVNFPLRRGFFKSFQLLPFQLLFKPNLRRGSLSGFDRIVNNAVTFNDLFLINC